MLHDLSGMVGAYVDEILTGTDTLENMVFALREVNVRLDKQKMYANPEKCCFGQSRWSTVVLLLGEMVYDHSQES